jgi:hypothetical protein
MATCTRCNGNGYEFPDDECYAGCYYHCLHCGGSGTVDDETAYQDKLQGVALVMADVHVREYKKYKDEDPDGEGFAFCAAENMMSEWDYRKSLVYEYMSVYMNRLDKCTKDQVDEYIRKLDSNENIEPLPDTNYCDLV